MTLKKLKLTHLDICLSAVIYKLHKENKEIYISNVIRNYETLFGTYDNRKRIINKIKELKNKGFIEFHYKKITSGRIPKFIKINDKFLLFYKLSMLTSMIVHDEDSFNEVAIPTLKKMIKYLNR